MLEATGTIASYADRGRAAFDADPALRDGILYQIVVLGEAAKAVVRADPSLVAELSGDEWSPLARMRDRLTHQYWATDREIVWLTATRDIPALRDVPVKAIERAE
jgi:uncharacterized protein with HEPN domain